MEFALDALQLLPIDESGLATNGAEVCGVTCGGGPTCFITLVAND